MQDELPKIILIIAVVLLMVGAFVFEQYAGFLSKKILAKHGMKGWAYQRAVWIYKNRTELPEDQLSEVNRFILSYTLAGICAGLLLMLGLIVFILS